MRPLRPASLAAALLAGTASFAAAALAPSTPPVFGQPVRLEVDAARFVHLPSTRFSIRGNAITVDLEHLAGGFGPFPPSFGDAKVDVGELLPGTYALQARFFDIAHPEAPPQVTTSTIEVPAPPEYGLFLVPREPEARRAATVLIHSGAYFDPRSVRMSMAGNVVRVDFDFTDIPVGRPVPAGMAASSTVTLPALSPGSYRLEGWGRPLGGGPAQLYFTRDFQVGRAVSVVEYYAEALEHYFVSAAGEELASLDADPQGGWKRTGQRFKAWLRETDAPAGARPVCRFYARGASTHFYTGDAAECEALRAQEAEGRAAAAAAGRPFSGWQYEGIAFHALVPSQGACAAGLVPVFRSYNDGAKRLDPNHRFTADFRQRTAMLASWVDEGPVFCSPP